jgi:hypothetical protein
MSASVSCMKYDYFGSNFIVLCVTLLSVHTPVQSLYAQYVITEKKCADKKIELDQGISTRPAGTAHRPSWPQP